MPRLFAAVALLALPALAASRPHSGPYELQLLVDGQPSQTYFHEGDSWILGQLGQRYTLRVINRSARRIEAVVSVDGRDVIDGQPGNLSKRGYLVPAYGSVDIDGWRISREQAAAFRFSSVHDSYAAQMGNGRDVGVIGVAVFTEQRPLPPPPPVLESAPRKVAPYGGSGMSSQAPAAAPPMSSVSKRAQAEDKASGLGTEYGEAVQSQITEVPFERAMAWPSAQLSLRYDDRAGLVAMGIDVDRGDETAYRRSATPFPGYDRAFAPPPPSWTR